MSLLYFLFSLFILLIGAYKIKNKNLSFYILVLCEHSSCQSVWRRVVDQLQNLFVVVLRININGQNWPKDLLHKTTQHNILKHVYTEQHGERLLSACAVGVDGGQSTEIFAC